MANLGEPFRLIAGELDPKSLYIESQASSNYVIITTGGRHVSVYDKRTDISRVQREILLTYFDNGMQGAGVENNETIQEAASATSLPINVVRGWIGNIKRTKGEQKTHDQKTVSGAPTGSNGYQLFCSRVGSKSADGPTRLREWKRLWSALQTKERDEYNREADANKKRKLSDLTAEERDRAIVKCTKVLSATFAKLDRLDANGLCVVEKRNETFGCSSAEGTKVLKENIDRIEDQFVIAAVEKQKAKKQKKSDQERDDLRTTFAEKMNGLYTTFIGKRGKFPYVKYLRNEADFIIQGLPSGINFRAGSLSSMPELRAVIEADLLIVSKEEQPSVCTVADGSLIVAQSSIPLQTHGEVNSADENSVPLYGNDGEILAVVQQLRTSSEEIQCDGDILPASELMDKMKVAALASKKKVNKKKGSKKITGYLERL